MADDRRVDKRKSGGGTCNVCYAPCSSCMHRNANELSDEDGSEASNLISCNENGVVDSQKVLIKELESLSSSLGLACDDEEENKNDKKTSVVIGSVVDRLLNKGEESRLVVMSESESADSEMLELDVKVCDICGDAGREDLLAFCSRCSDGAEHTYCMRVMLKKVPEGEWLCEECKSAEKAEKQKLETKWKRVTEANVNTQSSSKRLIHKLEAAPDAKRQAVESPTGSPKRSALPRLSTLSRETSFKGLEKTKRKLAHHSSFNSHSSDDTECSRSTDLQLQSSKGSFLKSSSFNSSSSRSKVKPVDDFMLPRPKTGKESAPLDANGSKQVKDRCAEANPSVSTVQHISRSNSSISNANSACDLKGFQPEDKQSSLKKQSRHLNRNRLEDIVASEQLSSEAKRKDEQTNVDGLSQSRECREVREKSKGDIGNRQRSDLLSQKGQNAEPTETPCASGSNLSTTRNIREDINKGNRLRAAVDAALRKKPSFGKNRGLEQTDLPSVSNVDSSCDKAFQNLPVVRDWPVFTVDPSCDKVFQNLPSKVPVVRDWPVSNVGSSCDKGLQNLPSKGTVVRDWPVGLQGGQSNLRTDKQATVVNGNQSTFAGADAMPSSQSVEPEVHISSIKPVKRDIPVAVPTVLLTKSAIPEPEYIWQGDLEVWKTGSLSTLHCGMQAYRSILASPKVVEVVNQFPVKVTLKEVPRLSTWPAHFHDVGAKEEHVALFFFAKDVESYEKSYKPLVDNMIQNDLALKGNLKGFELLIFSSNQLPQNCQRWNMLFFLWGVFRGRTKNRSNPPKNTPLPASCVLPTMRKPSTTCHENSSNREPVTDRASSRMRPSMNEEKAKEDNMSCAADKVKAFSVSYRDSGAVQETEEGEIGASPRLKNQKASGNKKDLLSAVTSSELKTGRGVKTARSIRKKDASASRKSGARPCEEKKNPAASERIVSPTDLNDEMVDINPIPLSNDNKKRRVNQDDDAASLSRSLSSASKEKKQQKKKQRSVSRWDRESRM